MIIRRLRLSKSCLVIIGGAALMMLHPAFAQSDAAVTHQTRGWALYGSKQYREALTEFTEAARLDPHDADAVLGEGRCHRLLKEYDAAVSDFTRAHELTPTAARPLCERGAILILQQKYDASLADYETAKTLDLNYPGLASYFAEVYLYRREPAKALAAVQEGEKRAPDLLIYKVNEAHSELFLGHFDRAKSIYLANRDRVESAKGITFAQIVLTDFRLMRAAGVTCPGMAEIESLMQTTQPETPTPSTP